MGRNDLGDAVSKDALRKASICYYEIIAGHRMPNELKVPVEKLVLAG